MFHGSLENSFKNKQTKNTQINCWMKQGICKRVKTLLAEYIDTDVVRSVCSSPVDRVSNQISGLNQIKVNSYLKLDTNTIMSKKREENQAQQGFALA